MMVVLDPGFDGIQGRCRYGGFKQLVSDPYYWWEKGCLVDGGSAEWYMNYMFVPGCVSTCGCSRLMVLTKFWHWDRNFIMVALTLVRLWIFPIQAFPSLKWCYWWYCSYSSQTALLFFRLTLTSRCFSSCEGPRQLMHILHGVLLVSCSTCPLWR
jgi:hypothetical protein